MSNNPSQSLLEFEMRDGKSGNKGDQNMGESTLLSKREPELFRPPTQSILYVPLQVNRFQKSILVIVQYKYLKSCSGDFYSPESDPPHKIMQYWFYYSI